ncbi:MAG: glycerophosphodiester phosphodiesterase [Novosphingobium sp.]
MDISRRTAIAGALALGTVTQVAGAKRAKAARPLVLGHRGCPARRPEHTLGSYAEAIALGADFIEPDLVPTKDGVLIARHEPNIAETSDVADHPEFAARKTTKVVDGERMEGWFTEDFTLAEIKTLRAKERLVGMRAESHGFDGQFQIVTFDEITDFVTAEAAARGRAIGLIPEIKHSTYFAAAGFDMEALFMERLTASAYCKTAPVIVQSFEVANLKRLRGMLGGRANVKLMQLIDEDPKVPADVAKSGGTMTYAEMLRPAGLVRIAQYADWVAPWTRQLIPLGADGALGKPTTIVSDAHRAGLKVGCYTFRPENHFLPVDMRSKAGDGARYPAGSVAEIRRYLALGIDGFFTDDAAVGRMAVGGVYKA